MLKSCTGKIMHTIKAFAHQQCKILPQIRNSILLTNGEKLHSTICLLPIQISELDLLPVSGFLVEVHDRDSPGFLVEMLLSILLPSIATAPIQLCMMGLRSPKNGSGKKIFLSEKRKLTKSIKT